MCPMCSISTRTTSPGTRKRGGFIAIPIPPGVPVATTSPGSSVKGGGQVLDQREAVEDELLRVRLLPQLAVHPRPDAERVRVAQLVPGHDPRPRRSVRVERLAHRP